MAALLLLLTLASTPLDQAMALEATGDDAAATGVLEQAVKVDPSWAIGHLELGRFALKQGQSELAHWHLDVARSLNPEMPRAHYLYALAADELGQRAEAKRALQVALTLRPGYADAQVRLAGVMIADGALTEAEQLLRSYVSTHPELSGPRLQLADVLERLGQFDGAVTELRALWGKPSLRAVAGRRLVALLEGRGRKEEAEEVRRSIDPPKRQMRSLQPSRK